MSETAEVSMESDLGFEDLVKAYMNIREARQQLKEKYELDDAALSNDMNTIEGLLLNKCNEINASSIRTGYGTVVRKLNERFYCNDWPNFRNFVLEHGAIELLERRIHQSNFKEFMEGRLEKDGLPPGVNVMREYGVVVRKPTK
jgi:hypothetical protein